ncbi:long-chain fatty acid--CoA ligase [Anaerobacillus alkaliphilus]|uniref:Long-chain fatty acid--CoA ligase n=1 Tax=Anaerobacillus alkaliphilus TaxID=1548597 RepID=A0A4Q0VS54_9BACI|nr:long-chain fatty acid--CoA ligase [Anaerobacillus alkaliphilus]RXJ00301.1 long-chain fatty acid--CoA ligase [Anaerobacillus alkaliphilus]
MSWDTDWLKKRARITPDRVAVVDGETRERWTYDNLNERAEHQASLLLDQGIGKGDRVALLAPNTVSYFDLLFACMKLGAIFVPLNWRLSSKEIAYILQDCQPKLLAYDDKFLPLIPNKYEGILLGVQQLLAGSQPIIPFDVSIEENDPLAIIYTGGTTGHPKGAVLTHKSVFYNAINTIISWNLTCEDTTVTYMPMFHTGGLNALSLPLLHIGGKVVIADKFEPNHLIDVINEEQCTILLLVPTMYHVLIQSERFQKAAFPSMHTFLSGGAPCSYRIYEAFAKKGLAFKEGYGLTEAGPNNFYINTRDVVNKRGSVGKPMLYNNVKIIDDDGRDVGSSEVGEILISGHHLFDHYWNSPSITAATIKNGWLYTGDLGKYDEDGYFYIVGRKKDMIITGGENVFPLEVEHVIAEHDLVTEVAVVGVADEKWGEIVTAFIVPKGGLTEAEVLTYCRTYLGSYKVPKVIRFVSQLPKTAVGKIDKKQLVEMMA